MCIPNGLIFPWNGANAAIPTGWTRETSLDGKFPKAWGSQNPNTTGGADTHSHASPTHTHTMIVHQHTANSSRDGAYESDGGSDPTFAARDSHIMEATNTDSISGGSLALAITYASVSGLLPYYEVIFVKPSGNYAFLTNGFLGFKADSTEPTGWKKCDGNSGTPNLTDKYLRGAATSGNAGGTGGATTHAHDIGHTHSTVQHQNVGYLYQPSDGSRAATPGGGGGAVAGLTHQHTWTSTLNTAEASSALTGTAGTAETIDLYYTKLYTILNLTGGANLPAKIIAMALSTTTPRGWDICDGTKGTPDLRNTFIKVTNTSGDIASQNTSAANAHAHASSNSHTHTASGTHVHPQGGTIGDSGVQGSTGAGGNGASQDHTHAYLEQTNAVTSTWNATTISANSADHQPAYRTVAYFMFKYMTGWNQIGIL